MKQPKYFYNIKTNKNYALTAEINEKDEEKYKNLYTFCDYLIQTKKLISLRFDNNGLFIKYNLC